jgi:hypothetical protein
LTPEEKATVERLYVATGKLRPLVKAISLFDRELGYRLTRLLDGFEKEIRRAL